MFYFHCFFAKLDLLVLLLPSKKCVLASLRASDFIVFEQNRIFPNMLDNFDKLLIVGGLDLTFHHLCVCFCAFLPFSVVENRIEVRVSGNVSDKTGRSRS